MEGRGHAGIMGSSFAEHIGLLEQQLRRRGYIFVAVAGFWVGPKRDRIPVGELRRRAAAAVAQARQRRPGGPHGGARNTGRQAKPKKRRRIPVLSGREMPQ